MSDTSNDDPIVATDPSNTPIDQMVAPLAPDDDVFSLVNPSPAEVPTAAPATGNDGD